MDGGTLLVVAQSGWGWGVWGGGGGSNWHVLALAQHFFHAPFPPQVPGPATGVQLSGSCWTPSLAAPEAQESQRRQQPDELRTGQEDKGHGNDKGEKKPTMVERDDGGLSGTPLGQSPSEGAHGAHAVEIRRVMRWRADGWSSPHDSCPGIPSNLRPPFGWFLVKRKIEEQWGGGFALRARTVTVGTAATRNRTCGQTLRISSP